MASSPSRLISLDAFRGATIALMVLVNTPGDGEHVYWPFQHAAWHGWTPTDVVFPSFLWIAGVALTLSLGRRIAAGVPRSTLFSQVLRRAALLFTLGVLIYVYPQFSLSTQRIMGVLQRIAICYAVAAAIYLTTTWRGQLAAAIGLLTVYWLLMAYAPVPGFGHGRLDVAGNFAHYIDRIVLGSHNYIHTKTWDPEGVVSTLPAIATALFGVLTGQIVASTRSLAQRTRWLLLGGAVLLVLGLVCNTWLPINKKLWTTSFSLFMAGLDSLLFACCLWFIDGKGWKRGARPFVILGMNSIAIYLASEFGEEAMDWIGLHESLYHALFASWASPYNASLLYAITYTLAMFAIAWVMDRSGWYVRV